MAIVWDTALNSRCCMRYSIHWVAWGTIFPEEALYSLVCGVQYSLGYSIHSDTGLHIYCKWENEANKDVIAFNLQLLLECSYVAI